MQVKLIHNTPEAEKHIAFCARVSSTNQSNPEYEKLIKYLITHKHWSPMEMASMCVEITTTRAIAPQLLRHKSFSFQELSQRYQQVNEFEKISARRQDLKNKQNSIDDLTSLEKDWFTIAQDKVWNTSNDMYEEALQKGIAKEVARNLLPLGTVTKLYMHGTLRSWIHYCSVRCDKSTQLEHREIADACWRIFRGQFPTIAKAAESLEPSLKDVLQ